VAQPVPQTPRNSVHTTHHTVRSARDRGSHGEGRGAPACWRVDPVRLSHGGAAAFRCMASSPRCLNQRTHSRRARDGGLWLAVPRGDCSPAPAAAQRRPARHAPRPPATEASGLSGPPNGGRGEGAEGGRGREEGGGRRRGGGGARRGQLCAARRRQPCGGGRRGRRVRRQVARRWPPSIRRRRAVRQGIFAAISPAGTSVPGINHCQ
jgi:hypothetical protein